MDSLSIAASQVPYYQPQGTKAPQAPAFAGGAQAAAYTPQASQVQESGGLSLGKLLAGTAAVIGTVAAVKTHHTNGLLKEIGKDGAKVAEGAEGALAKTHELSIVDTFVQNLNPLNWFSKDKEGIEKLATDAKVKAVGENGLYQSIDGDTLHIRNGNKFTEIKAKEGVKAPDAVVADAPPVVPPVTPPPVAPPKAPAAPAKLNGFENETIESMADVIPAPKTQTPDPITPVVTPAVTAKKAPQLALPAPEQPLLLEYKPTYGPDKALFEKHQAASKPFIFKSAEESANVFAQTQSLSETASRAEINELMNQFDSQAPGRFSFQPGDQGKMRTLLRRAPGLSLDEAKEAINAGFYASGTFLDMPRAAYKNPSTTELLRARIAEIKKANAA